MLEKKNPYLLGHHMVAEFVQSLENPRQAVGLVER